jgi:hypothetical protein
VLLLTVDPIRRLFVFTFDVKQGETMKKLSIAIVLTGSVLLASNASAQDTPKQVIDIEAMLLEGGVWTPDAVIMGKTTRAKFERMLTLKRSFLPNIEKDTASQSLN